MAGRRRDQRLDDAIVRAAVDAIAEHGYDRLGMEAVAARVGVPKSTVYKRWPSRSALASAALAGWLMDPGPEPEGDEGALSALTDLVAEEIALARRPEGRALAQLILSHLDHPDQGSEPLLSALAERRSRFDQAVRAARGQPDPDPLVELGVDLLVGAAWAPVLSGRTDSGAKAEDIVRAVLEALDPSRRSG